MSTEEQNSPVPGPVPVVPAVSSQGGAGAWGSKMSFKEVLLRGVEEEEREKEEKLNEEPEIEKKEEQPEVVSKEKVAEEKEESSVPSSGDATVTVKREPGGPSIHTLVLDAGPLLAQTFSDLQKRASRFFTTPAVLHTEVRDARARANIELWQTAGLLGVRQPTAGQVAAVADFAKRTGDFAVLSTNDLHVLALARELDVEVHGGSDAHLRKMPGGEGALRGKELEGANFRAPVTYNVRVDRIRPGEEEDEKEEKEKEETEDDGWSTVSKKSKPRRFNHKYNNNNSNKGGEDGNAELTSKMANLNISTSYEEEEEEKEEGWITEDNIVETMRKDQYEPDESSFLATVKPHHKNGEESSTAKAAEEEPFLPAAVSTGDFAMQNVALQMGLNLVSPVDGKKVRQVKSHMLRCHACFHLCPVPRTNDVDEIMEKRRGNQKTDTSLSSSVLGRGLNFCPQCGSGNTLRRCTVRVDGRDGHIHVYLKRHMQWSTRGNIQQLGVPQSKNARRQGRVKDPYDTGSQPILREDQKEYERAIVHDWKQKRQNEKVLEEWIGGSIGAGGDVSAGAVGVPFAYHRDAARHTGIRIGPSRGGNKRRGGK